MYKEYLPCRLLAPYIDRYWEFEGQTEYGMRINILADGCSDYIFTLGNAVDTVNESILMKPYHTYFVGPMDTYSELVSHTDNIHMLGVRFLPCGLSRFIDMPLDVLTNIRVSVNDLNSIFNDSFAERLSELSLCRDRINLIENFLIKLLYQSNGMVDVQVGFAVNQINRYGGKLSMRDLMEDICLSQRHFERKFKAHTGFSPKKYSSIIKFKNAIDLLKHTPFDNLLSVAVKAGYYDVSHLVREVKSLSGSTPASFLLQPPESESSLFFIE